MAMLEVKNLHVNYGAIEALHGVDLRVEQGQIVTLIGCNGAGKSTMLRAVAGMVRCARGNVTFEGKVISGKPAHELVRMWIAMAPEGRGIFANLTVDENLAIGAYARTERMNQRAGTLSGGEQQMLAIGRALLARPRLLLLDEPSLGLAPQIVQTIFHIIREINESGTTILLVEQNAHMALHTAHYGYVLEVGKIVMNDEARRLAASDQVRKAYLGVA